MDQIQSSLVASVHQAQDYIHTQQTEFENKVHDVQDKLDQLGQIDFRGLVIDEAKDMSHNLKEKTGLDLGQIIPELKELDTALADAQDAAFYAAEAERAKLQAALCVKYSETLADKTTRLAGFFQDWRPW